MKNMAVTGWELLEKVMVYSLHIKQKTLHTSLLERPNPLSSSSHRAKKNSVSIDT